MIYFDNAATTLVKPESTARLMNQGLTSLQYGNPGRGSHRSSLNALEELYKTREAVAKLFNIKASSNIALTQNASASLNLTLFSLFSGKKCHVVTSYLEHNSVLRPLYMLEKQGLTLSFAENDALGKLSYTSLESKIQGNTEAIVITAASNVTGNKTNLKLVHEIAQKYNLILVVDASQLVGMSALDMAEFNNTIFCFTGHKGLLGPMGTGCIAVNGDFNFEPVFAGGSGFHSFDHEHPKTMPDVFEVGTMNVVSFMGLRGGVEFVLETGIEKIEKHVASLRKRFLQGLKNIKNIKLYGETALEASSSIVALNIGSQPSSEISFQLDDRFGIATRPGAHCAPLMHESFGTKEQGIVRFSFSYFNTEAEIDKCLAALETLSKEMG